MPSRSLAQAVSPMLDACLPRRCLASGQPLADGERDITRDVGQKLAELVVQPFCRSCGTPIDDVAVGSPMPDRCQRCPTYHTPWESLTRVGPYVWPWREAIVAYKFNGRLDAEGPLAARLAASIEAADWPTPAAIVPVPQHWYRSLERQGFSPVDGIARRVAARLGVATASMLKRVKLGHQTGSHRVERQRAVRDAYAIRWPASLQRLLGWQRLLEDAKRLDERGRPAGVLLLDDIATTRATLSACTQQLMSLGLSVRVAVLATAEPEASDRRTDSAVPF